MRWLSRDPMKLLSRYLVELMSGTLVMSRYLMDLLGRLVTGDLVGLLSRDMGSLITRDMVGLLVGDLR